MDGPSDHPPPSQPQSAVDDTSAHEEMGDMNAGADLYIPSELLAKNESTRFSVYLTLGNDNLQRLDWETASKLRLPTGSFHYKMHCTWYPYQCCMVRIGIFDPDRWGVPDNRVGEIIINGVSTKSLEFKHLDGEDAKNYLMQLCNGNKDTETEPSSPRCCSINLKISNFSLSFSDYIKRLIRLRSEPKAELLDFIHQISRKGEESTIGMTLLCDDLQVPYIEKMTDLLSQRLRLDKDILHPHYPYHDLFLDGQTAQQLHYDNAPIIAPICNSCHGTADKGKQCPTHPVPKKCRHCRSTDHESVACVNRACKICRETGHLRANCPQRICRFCMQRGHDQEDCPDRIVSPGITRVPTTANLKQRALQLRDRLSRGYVQQTAQSSIIAEMNNLVPAHLRAGYGQAWAKLPDQKSFRPPPSSR